MKRTEYNEVYGWMPQEIINKLQENDRSYMFLEYLKREPTPAGRYIVTTTVKELGDPFIEYLFKKTMDSLKEDFETVTKKDLLETVSDLFRMFTTDLNTFQDYVDTYLEDTNTVLEEEVQKKQIPERDSKGRFIKKK